MAVERLDRRTHILAYNPRFKGLIWGLPEVYLRFEGLMVK